MKKQKRMVALTVEKKIKTYTTTQSEEQVRISILVGRNE